MRWKWALFCKYPLLRSPRHPLFPSRLTAADRGIDWVIYRADFFPLMPLCVNGLFCMRILDSNTPHGGLLRLHCLYSLSVCLLIPALLLRMVRCLSQFNCRVLSFRVSFWMGGNSYGRVNVIEGESEVGFQGPSNGEITLYVLFFFTRSLQRCSTLCTWQLGCKLFQRLLSANWDAFNFAQQEKSGFLVSTTLALFDAVRAWDNIPLLREKRL